MAENRNARAQSVNDDTFDGDNDGGSSNPMREPYASGVTAKWIRTTISLLSEAVERPAPPPRRPRRDLRGVRNGRGPRRPPDARRAAPPRRAEPRPRGRSPRVHRERR